MSVIRQEDIAKKLNISRTTVARALNGTGSINPDTKEKILKECEELGYAKNPISTSLASKKKRCVYAFIIKTRDKNYAKEIKQGFKSAESELKFYKYELNIIETDIDSPELQLEQLKEVMKNKDVDGIIITPLLKKEISNIRRDNPHVFFIALDFPLDAGTVSIYSNYFKSGRITADILLNVLNKGDKILLLDTEDDRASSKLYFEGFTSKIYEQNKCEIIGPIYQGDLKNNIGKVIDENLTPDIAAIYSSRFLVSIIEYICKTRDIELKVVANGSSEDKEVLIRNNKIVATVVEKYEELGYLAARYMFEYLYKGIKPVNFNTEIESKILFKENLSPKNSF